MSQLSMSKVVNAYWAKSMKLSHSLLLGNYFQHKQANQITTAEIFYGISKNWRILN